MGVLTQPNNKMKSIFFVACIAAAFAAPEAEAEADPAYLTYSSFPATTYGFGGYRSAYNYPAYNAYNGFYRHFYKRTADAEAEADPTYLTYGYPATTYGYGYHHPAVSTVHSAYVAPTYYSHALNNVHYLGKRSAEAEADPAYLAYSGYTPYAAYTPYFGANYYGGYRAYNRFW